MKKGRGLRVGVPIIKIRRRRFRARFLEPTLVDSNIVLSESERDNYLNNYCMEKLVKEDKENREFKIYPHRLSSGLNLRIHLPNGEIIINTVGDSDE